MKQLLSLIICVFVLLTVSNTQAEEDSLFPKPDDVNKEKPSLDSAIAQFEQVIESSTTGEFESLKANDKYNRQRVLEIERQLAEKKLYLETIPEIVSRQFDALMKQYADTDQKTKNKMADDLHAKWKAKEDRVKREIAELEEQLAVTTNRISESAMKRQMLDVSNSLSQTEKAFRQKQTEKETDLNAESPAFQNMRDLSRRRILSTIQGFCSIQVKPLDSELSIKYLDN